MERRRSPKPKTAGSSPARGTSFLQILDTQIGLINCLLRIDVIFISNYNHRILLSI